MTRPSATEVSVLVRRLGSRSPARVEAAQARLAIVGARAVEELIEALEGDDNRVRSRAMPLLALIQDPRGREPLIAMLLDRNPRLRRIAARSLARFPSQEAVAALERTLDRDKSDVVRAAALESLIEQYGAGQESALRSPLGVVIDSGQDPALRRAAMSLLPLLRPSHRRSVFRGLAGDPSPEIREAASHSDAADSPRPAEAELEAALSDLGATEYDVWNRAVQRLGRTGAAGVRRMIREMQARAHDPEYCTRAGMALRGLGPRRGRLVGDALGEVDHPIPLQALVDVIGAMGQKDQIYRLADLIERVSGSEGPLREADGFEPMQRVRAKAHLELARIGSRVAIVDLRDCLATSERRIELEVIAAVQLIGKGEELLLLLGAYGREDAYMKTQIAGAVRGIMRREQIRRNSRLFHDLSRSQRRALSAILPPTPMRAPRARPRTGRLSG